MRADQAIYIYKCQLVRVIDADTVEAGIDKGFREVWTMPIRFTDFDAWEIKGEFREHGLVAKQYLFDIFKTFGPWFYLHSDRDEIAIYNRVGGRIYIPVGTMFLDVVQTLKRAGMEKGGVPDIKSQYVYVDSPSITQLVRAKLNV
jgi:hypothetical protein